MILSRTLNFKLVFINSAFDPFNYSNPIQQYIDDRFFWPLLSEHTRLNVLEIKKSEAVLFDNIVTSFLNPDEADLYEMGNNREMVMERKDDLILELMFVYDREYFLYERR